MVKCLVHLVYSLMAFNSRVAWGRAAGVWVVRAGSAMEECQQLQWPHLAAQLAHCRGWRW